MAATLKLREFVIFKSLLFIKHLGKEAIIDIMYERPDFYCDFRIASIVWVYYTDGFRRRVIIAESLSQHDEKHVVRTPT
jgi:hypothetical protein